MFIFILWQSEQQIDRSTNLHSTMFIFIWAVFQRMNMNISHLHSTMFIFISVNVSVDVTNLFKFTFHYVYIYMELIRHFLYCNKIYIPLCLYLYELPCKLIPKQIKFTFHYVYIYINSENSKSDSTDSFTFHYVYIYINKVPNLNNRNIIYIPLCLYLYAE